MIGQIVALGVAAVLLIVLGVRHGGDAFVIGLGLVCLGSLVEQHGRGRDSSS